MKILILGFAKIKYMPYVNFYLDNIKKTSNEVHLLYWNRDLNDEDTSALSDITLHEFRCRQEDNVSPLLKIKSFVKYKKYALEILNSDKFDFIIILHSLPGALLCDALQKRYKGKYIFDYRDSTYERFKVYKNTIGKLVKGSIATFVSSNAFRRFLPESEKNKIYTSHNMLMDSLSHRDEKEKYGVESDKIRIAFWGFIRNERVNREIIKKISQDSRFELHYYGREQQTAINLKEYVRELNAKNVFFHGEYKPEDRYKFVRETDIIHNIYNDGNMMIAMGNKYYDAAFFYIPLVSMRGSFMAETAKRAKIGFEADPYDEDFSEQLFTAYSRLDRKQFLRNCDKELERVIYEYNSGADFIRRVTDSEVNR